MVDQIRLASSLLHQFFMVGRRGCVMIPASLNCIGWSLIHKELRNFLSGAKLATMAGALSKNFGGVVMVR